MKHTLLAVALASTFTFFTKPTQPPADPGALGVEVQCEPSSRGNIQLLRRPTPSTYHCNAYVFDVSDTTRGVAGAQVIVGAGERRVKSEKHDDAQITFTVAISKDHDRAATDVVVTKAGKTVLRQKSDFMLLSNVRR
jgi:hypothetical protein